MDTTSLSQKKIEEGKLLLSKLDEDGIKTASAFWLYEKTRGATWKLYLAFSSPEFDVKNDPLKARRILSDVVQSASVLTILTLDDIQLIPLDHPFITNITKSIQTGPGIVSMRMSKNQFDTLFVEDIFIYKMNAF